jgi:hypothetical protein
MGSGGRIAAAVVGGLLQGGGKALELTAEQRFKEKLLKLENERRQTERQEDRDFQREIEGERQFSTLARDTMQIKAAERKDEAAAARENAREERAEGRHRETLRSQTERSQAELDAKTDLIEEEDGTLSRVKADGTAIKVTRDGQPVKGKKVNPNTASPPREGLTAEHSRMVNLAMTNAGIDSIIDDEDKKMVAAELRKLKAPDFLVAAYEPPPPAKAPAPGTATAAETPKPAIETAPGPAAPTYNSAADVRAAVRSGKLSIEEAQAILIQKFGYQ